jgi:predicted metalloprotease with PDZ domain
LRKSVLLAAIAFLALPASAQVTNGEPQPIPIVDRTPDARDIDYPGTLSIHVDATDVARHIYRVKQTIPLAGPGPLTLLYPEWLPGNHAPRGPIQTIAGLKISANGQPIAWRRDNTDVYAFHIDVPAGVSALDVEFQHLSPSQPNQGRVTMTPDMLNLQWEKMSLYPAGYFVRGIRIEPSVTLPAGWTGATSLDVASQEGSRITYQPVSYETLVDSPMFAGRHYRKVELAPDVDLNIFADRPEDLAAKPEHIEAHRKLVEQALKLYRADHYDEYEFLVALTDQLGGIGLEHLRSSENSHPRTYFTAWDEGSAGRDLLAHELNHSWNGKYRRPAGMIAPDYSTPTRNDLLWVYEGQTQFWGNVLSARSGMMPVEDVKSELARVAAYYDTLPGRTWRPLIDTTYDPIVQSRRPQPWSSWLRGEDYYSEGMLIWLEADARLRQLTDGRRSIDDFARAFFGVNPGDQGILTYRFDDVAATLNAIAPSDWDAWLRRRVERAGPAPLAWIEAGGYRLVYRDTPTDYFKAREKARKILDLTYTLGLVVGEGGRVSGVAWDSPPFEAGLTVGSTIVAVNGRQYSHDLMKQAITAARGTREPIRLLVKRGETYREVPIAYHDGLRYPVLERVGSGASSLDALLAPLA